MSTYSILVIDDDEPIHLFTEKVLGDNYNLTHANSAQEGIDLLSEQPFNLVLTDVHMPGLSGLEFLHALKNDAAKKQVPVLVMTNLPSVEKEKKALDYGAADFINKSDIVNDREGLKRRVELKLVTNVVMPDLDDDLVAQKNRIVTKIMTDSGSNDFQATAKGFSQEIADQFDLGYLGLWTFDGGTPELVCQAGKYSPDDYDFSGGLLEENSFKYLKNNREPYLSNSVFGEGEGIMQEFSEKHELVSEISIPLFAVDEHQLLMNDMEVPSDTEIFGLIVLKRNKLFTSEEYEVISKLLGQTGSVLWSLYADQQ
ncbi:MAG: response regulator [Fodinibius sp.]|nr:response regulator [Fodinibius sp.]